MSNESSQIPRNSSRTPNQGSATRPLNSSIGYFNRSQSRPISSLDDYDDCTTDDLSKKRYSSCSLNYPLLKVKNDIDKDSMNGSQSGGKHGNKRSPLSRSSTSSEKHFRRPEQLQQSSVVVPKLDLKVIKNEQKKRNMYQNNENVILSEEIQKITSSGSEVMLGDDVFVKKLGKESGDERVVTPSQTSSDNLNIGHSQSVDPITHRNNLIIEQKDSIMTSNKKITDSSSLKKVKTSSKDIINNTSKTSQKKKSNNNKKHVVKVKVNNKYGKKKEKKMYGKMLMMEDEKERDGLEVSEIPSDLSACDSSPCRNELTVFMDKEGALEMDFDNKSFYSMYHINEEEMTDFSDMGSTCTHYYTGGDGANLNELMDTQDSNKLFGDIDNNYLQDEDMNYFTTRDDYLNSSITNTSIRSSNYVIFI